MCSGAPCSLRGGRVLPMNKSIGPLRPTQMAKTAATGPDLRDEHLLARIACAVWALIAVLALPASIEPMRTAGTNVAATAALGIGAAVVAGAMLLMPQRRRTKGLCELILVAAVFYSGALAYAAG